MKKQWKTFGNFIKTKFHESHLKLCNARPWRSIWKNLLENFFKNKPGYWPILKNGQGQKVPTNSDSSAMRSFGPLPKYLSFISFRQRWKNSFLGPPASLVASPWKETSRVSLGFSMSLSSSSTNFKTWYWSIHTKLVSPSSGCEREVTSKGQPCKMNFWAHLSISMGLLTSLSLQNLIHSAVAVPRLSVLTAVFRWLLPLAWLTTVVSGDGGTGLLSALLSGMFLVTTWLLSPTSSPSQLPLSSRKLYPSFNFM